MQQSLQPKLSCRRYASVSYALQNNTVFRRAQNWVSVGDGSRTDHGSEFQSVGPETAKHLWLYLVVLERGTARSPRAAEQRWPRSADLDTGEHSSARYVGAAWCIHLYTRTHTLYSILRWTGSQWRFSSINQRNFMPLPQSDTTPCISVLIIYQGENFKNEYGQHVIHRIIMYHYFTEH